MTTGVLLKRGKGGCSKDIGPATIRQRKERNGRSKMSKDDGRGEPERNEWQRHPLRKRTIASERTDQTSKRKKMKGNGATESRTHTAGDPGPGTVPGPSSKCRIVPSEKNRNALTQQCPQRKEADEEKRKREDSPQLGESVEAETSSSQNAGHPQGRGRSAATSPWRLDTQRQQNSHGSGQKKRSRNSKWREAAPQASTLGRLLTASG
jgi:hypothetical protein